MNARLSYDNRVAVISGGGRGLGRAYALDLAQRGVKIVVNDPGVDIHGAGSAPAAEAVVAEIEALGGQAAASTTIVRDTATADEVVRLALEAFGSCDIVINSAGILRDRTFAKMSEDELHAVLTGHVLGPFFLSQAAFREMKTRQHGRIVFTSSAAGLFGNFGQSNYALAKAGVVGLMRVLALEGRSHGVVANTIAPLAATRMANNGLVNGMPEQLTAEFVAPLVSYLASDDCTETKKVFSVGGGHIAEVFLAESPGWTSGGPMTAEDVRANLESITSRGDVLEFADAFEEIAHVCRELGIANPYGEAG